MISYGFFNSAPGTADRAYDATQFNSVVRGMFSDGRAPMFGEDQFIVSATSISYQISVTPGLYFFKGLWFSSTENEVINIASPGSDLALVVRYSMGNRVLGFEVVEQSQVDINTDAVLAYFNKAGDGTIIVTKQFYDIAEAGNKNTFYVSATLHAQGWVNDTYTITADWISASTNDMEIYPDLADDATSTEAAAFDAAWIWWESQAAGSVTLRAETVPAIDIPIVLKVLTFKPSPKLAILSTNPYQSLQTQITGLSGSIDKTNTVVSAITGGDVE